MVQEKAYIGSGFGKDWVRKKPRLELEVPGQAICDVNKAIMVDEDTADFTLRCETREFKVHKSFLCSRLVQTKPATISII